MKKWTVDQRFRSMLVPVTDEPCRYDLYIVLRDRKAAQRVPAALQEAMLDAIAQVSVAHLVLWYPVGAGVKEQETMSYADSAVTLKDVGLEFLAGILDGHIDGVSVRTLSAGQKVELPFVLEFAHDPTRAEKLVQGAFYDIMPMTAELIPTLNCPFRCIDCAYKVHKTVHGLWSGHHTGGKRWNMERGIVAPIVRKLAEAGVQNIVITGGGEPLLNMEAVRLALQEAKRRGMRTGLYTNGALLHHHAEALLQEEPQFVRISVNAASPVGHARYHNPLNCSVPYFDNITKGLERLTRYRLQKNYATEIGLSFIVNPFNVGEIEQFGTWIGGLSDAYERASKDKPLIDFVRFTPTIGYFSHTQYPQELFDEAITGIKEHVAPVLQALGTRLILFTHRFHHIERKKDYDACLGCPWFAEVAPDGSLYLCCEMNFFPGYWMGNLVDDDLPTIWTSSTRKELLRRVNNGLARTCPSFCKADRLSSVLHKIKQFNTSQQKKQQILEWIGDLHAVYRYSEDDFFVRQTTVAF